MVLPRERILFGDDNFEKGFDYKANTPWDAKNEFCKLYDSFSEEHNHIILIANSIGAFYSLHSLNDKRIVKAFFISPIVDMEKLIHNMMEWAGVSEKN